MMTMILDRNLSAMGSYITPANGEYSWKMLLTLQWFTDVTNFPPNTDKRILKAETAV
jgi:hypothetical protein